MGKPSFPDLSSWPDELWAADVLPDLTAMVGPESWLLFNKIGLDEEDLVDSLDSLDLLDLLDRLITRFA